MCEVRTGRAAQENSAYRSFAYDRNHGSRWLFHAGVWDGALSDMELQPQFNLGYFFWSNQGGDDNRKLRAELNAALAERYFAGCSG